MYEEFTHKGWTILIPSGDAHNFENTTIEYRDAFVNALLQSDGACYMHTLPIEDAKEKYGHLEQFKKFINMKTPEQLLEEIKAYCTQQAKEIEGDHDLLMSEDDDNYSEWEEGRIAGTKNVLDGMGKIIFGQ